LEDIKYDSNGLIDVETQRAAWIREGMAYENVGSRLMIEKRGTYIFIIISHLFTMSLSVRQIA
jgi:hypothetical protein